MFYGVPRARDTQRCCDAQGKPEFGYTRKDIILIGGGLIGFGFALYYGLQAGGVDALVAGNFVQLFVILGICLGYISTYFIRVANKVLNLPLLWLSLLVRRSARCPAGRMRPRTCLLVRRRI
jgi:hypothetical protein